MPAFWRVAAKALVLLAGWIVASLPPLRGRRAVEQLRRQPLSRRSSRAVALGHVLNAGLTIALAPAAASVTEHPSTAAIVTLERHRRHVDPQLRRGRARRRLGARWPATRRRRWSPSSSTAWSGSTSCWSRVAARRRGPGARGDLDAARRRRCAARVYESVGARRRSTAAGARRRARSSRASWDLSENRMNSFPRADEEALRADPRAAAHRSAPGARGSAPRRSRAARAVEAAPRDAATSTCATSSATSTGLFEQTSAALRRDLVRARRPARR